MRLEKGPLVFSKDSLSQKERQAYILSRIVEVWNDSIMNTYRKVPKPKTYSYLDTNAFHTYLEINAYLKSHHYDRYDPIRYFSQAFYNHLAITNGKQKKIKVRELFNDKVNKQYRCFSEKAVTTDPLDGLSILANPLVSILLGAYEGLEGLYQDVIDSLLNGDYSSKKKERITKYVDGLKEDETKPFLICEAAKDISGAYISNSLYFLATYHYYLSKPDGLTDLDKRMGGLLYLCLPAVVYSYMDTDIGRLMADLYKEVFKYPPLFYQADRKIIPWKN